MTKPKQIKIKRRLTKAKTIVALIICLLFGGVGTYLVFGARAATSSLTPDLHNTPCGTSTTQGVGSADLYVVDYDTVAARKDPVTYMRTAGTRYDDPTYMCLDSDGLGRHKTVAQEITVYARNTVFSAAPTCASKVSCYPGKVLPNRDPDSDIQQYKVAYSFCFNVEPDLRVPADGGVWRTLFTLHLKTSKDYRPGDVRFSGLGISVACGKTLHAGDCDGLDMGGFYQPNEIDRVALCQGASSPGYTPGGKTPGPGTGGTTGNGSGSGGQGTGKSGSSKSPTQSTGGGGSSATKQGDKSKTTPSTSAQGNQSKQTKLDPNPFYDGKEYEPGSDVDKGIGGAIRKTGRSVVRVAPYVIALVLLGGLLVLWWRKRVQKHK